MKTLSGLKFVWVGMDSKGNWDKKNAMRYLSLTLAMTNFDCLDTLWVGSIKEEDGFWIATVNNSTLNLKDQVVAKVKSLDKAKLELLRRVSSDISELVFDESLKFASRKELEILSNKA